MEDWEARLAALDKTLVEWNAKFAGELERVVQERRLRGLFRMPRRQELDAAAAEARKRAGLDVLVEAAALFDALCDVFLGALPQERCKIRARVGSLEAVFAIFWNYVEGWPERIRKPDDEKGLVRAFTAVAIDDMRVDVEQLDALVGRLIIAAVAAGIDWKSCSKTVAKVANKGAGGGGTCMREYFGEFERTKYFAEHVAGELPAAARRAMDLQVSARR